MTVITAKSDRCRLYHSVAYFIIWPNPGKGRGNEKDEESSDGSPQTSLTRGIEVSPSPLRSHADGSVASVVHSHNGARMSDIENRKAAGEVLRISREELEVQVAERTAALRQEVHDRRKAEDELRELSGRLLTLRDTEQRRIARDLHDSAGQLLAATTMNLALVAKESSSISPEAAKALYQAADLVQKTLKEVRIVSHLLHPPLLDESGLASALRWYLDGFSGRGDIKVELVMSNEFGRLPIDLETTIFRIVQECLTNIHRHSGSKTARVEVLRFPSEIRVEVQDKGKGMPIERPSGVGLRGMRERAGQFRGQLEIRSSVTGTMVVARLPFASEQLTARLSSQPHDLVVADYLSPNWEGTQALEPLHQSGKQMPLIRHRHP